MKAQTKNTIEPGKLAGYLFNVLFALFGAWYIVKTLVIYLNNL